MIPYRHDSMQPELSAALDFIAQCMEDDGLKYEEEWDGIDPDLWTCVAYDKDGYVNGGFVGWSKVTNSLHFYAYDPLRANHDQMEGVSEDESACFWDARSADVFVMFLTGEVRQMMNRHRTIKSEEKS